MICLNGSSKVCYSRWWGGWKDQLADGLHYKPFSGGSHSNCLWHLQPLCQCRGDPSICQVGRKTLEIKHWNVILTLTSSLWDTAGQEAYDLLRLMAYKDCGVIILCFSISAPGSLRNIETVWIPGKNIKGKEPFTQ